jgi:dienelactone hydrolase
VPRGSVRAAVVVLHEICGATSRIRCVMSQLCAASYAAAAPQLKSQHRGKGLTEARARTTPSDS